jgi:anti-sigma regulatory factor (Ser/Thr protein kinase)
VQRHTPEPSTGSDTDAGTDEPTAPAAASAPIDASVRSSFEELVPAASDEMSVLRRKLTAWLDELPVDPGSSYDIVLATYEALANVAAHAYPGGHGWARLYADWAGDTVTVVVSDTGSGGAVKRVGAPPLTAGGRGLLLIDEVTDQAIVESGEHGTRVTMIWRPAALRS